MEFNAFYMKQSTMTVQLCKLVYYLLTINGLQKKKGVAC